MEQQLRSLRDFLLVYNRVTERCFQRCVAGMGQRPLSAEEESCLDRCAAKHLRGSHRLMSAYVRLVPGLVQRRLEPHQEDARVGAPPEPQRSRPAGGEGEREGRQ